jgi:hypothetical protein
MDEASDAFDAIAEELRRETVWDQRAEAREILAAGTANRTFGEMLTRIPRGDTVALVTVDGTILAGRVLAVGRDWVRLGEVADPTGTARARLRRVHDLRLEAIVRVVREHGE